VCSAREVNPAVMPVFQLVCPAPTNRGRGRSNGCGQASPPISILGSRNAGIFFQGESTDFNLRNSYFLPAVICGLKPCRHGASDYHDRAGDAGSSMRDFPRRPNPKSSCRGGGAEWKPLAAIHTLYCRRRRPFDTRRKRAEGPKKRIGLSDYGEQHSVSYVFRLAF